MRLNEEEYYKYLEIHQGLIYYVGKKKKLIPTTMSLDTFLNFSIPEKFPIRNALYENIHLWDDYIKENSENLSDDDKDIIRGFKYFKEGNFYIVKLTKKYALFLGDKYVYGVHALSDPFQSLLGNNLPVMVKKKELRGLGIKKRWFALYEDTIILSGQSEKEVTEEIRKLIPDAKKREGVFYFNI